MVRQGDYVRKGGRIIRILCLNQEDNDAEATALEACKAMTEYGIHAFISAQRYWETDDFLWFPSLNFAHTWRPLPNRSATEMVYFSPDTLTRGKFTRGLRKSWKEAKNHEDKTPAQLDLPLPY